MNMLKEKRIRKQNYYYHALFVQFFFSSENHNYTNLTFQSRPWGGLFRLPLKFVCMLFILKLLSASRLYIVELWNDLLTINWKGFWRKKLWPTRSTIPTFIRRVRRKPKTPPSGYSIFRPRFESAISQIQNQSVTIKFYSVSPETYRNSRCILKQVITL
jgi:hypothetical protein